MINERTLKRIIEKAGKNGYTLPYIDWSEFVEDDEIEPVIFSVEFAQAFWGEGKPKSITVNDGPEWEITLPDGSHKYMPLMNWQYHLQTMILEEDPVKYLAQFLI